MSSFITHYSHCCSHCHQTTEIRVGEPEICLYCVVTGVGEPDMPYTQYSWFSDDEDPWDHCAHEWSTNEETNRCYCLLCGADGDA